MALRLARRAPVCGNPLLRARGLVRGAAGSPRTPPSSSSSATPVASPSPSSSVPATSGPSLPPAQRGGDYLERWMGARAAPRLDEAPPIPFSWGEHWRMWLPIGFGMGAVLLGLNLWLPVDGPPVLSSDIPPEKDKGWVPRTPAEQAEFERELESIFRKYRYDKRLPHPDEDWSRGRPGFTHERKEAMRARLAGLEQRLREQAQKAKEDGREATGTPTRETSRAPDAPRA